MIRWTVVLLSSLVGTVLCHGGGGGQIPAQAHPQAPQPKQFSPSYSMGVEQKVPQPGMYSQDNHQESHHNHAHDDHEHSEDEKQVNQGPYSHQHPFPPMPPYPPGIYQIPPPQGRPAFVPYGYYGPWIPPRQPPPPPSSTEEGGDFNPQRPPAPPEQTRFGPQPHSSSYKTQEQPHRH